MSWYKSSNHPVAVSTRIRFARNIAGVPFKNRMTEEQHLQVNRDVIDAVKNSNTAFADMLQVVEMEKLSDLQAAALAEKHLISPGFAADRKNRILLLSKDETVSIMVCEEDHIRLQVIMGGLCVKAALDMADKLDTVLSEKLNIAFDKELGYLSQCPTNLGTGLRASVMLHLPALEQTKGGESLFKTVGKMGLTVRGMYGEGSSSAASLYQLSNQITLGISEKAAAENLELIAGSVIANELQARENLRSVRLEDEVFRSLGILRHARLVSGSEMMKLLSKVRLGASMGIIDGMDITEITRFMVESRPAVLSENCGVQDTNERDVLRANKARKLFSREERE